MTARSSTLSTQRRVSHSLGYVGLGMFKEAVTELDSITTADQFQPEVRAARIELQMAAKQWDKVIEIGSDLARTHPEIEHAWIAWAYALRELDRVVDARMVLFKAEPHHGQTSAVLHYNLACYDSLLGRLASAQARLDTACRMDKRFEAEARVDPDLQALRNDRARMP
jgi:Flp pilus assembly protein TadD